MRFMWDSVVALLSFDQICLKLTPQVHPGMLCMPNDSDGVICDLEAVRLPL